MFDQYEGDLGELFAGESAEELYRLTLEAHQATVDDPVDLLPDELEGMAPGLFLAAVLGSVDRSRLSGYDLVRYLQAQQRLSSHVDGGLYAAIGEVAYAYDPDTPARTETPVEFASEEIQTALVWTRRRADFDLGLALDLRCRIPEVFEALSQGRIDLARARVFATETETLDSRLVRGMVDSILGQAPDLTTGQLRSRLKKLCLQADPDSAQAQFEAGVEDRRVVTAPNPDFTASILIGSVRPEDAIEASEHVHASALVLKGRPGETRSIDQLKADVAVDLLKGHTPDGIQPVQARIIIHMTDAETARVPGYGPILGGSLQTILQDREIDTPTGETVETVGVVEVSADGDCHQTASRRPTPSQARHVRSRYPTCVFPGCRMPAEKCDLDHRHQYSKGGRTSCHNLAPLCRHHHVCKDQTHWNLERNLDQSHTWTSPLGHTYPTGRPP